MSESKLQRTLVRFRSKIDSGEYYEAHQTLRTIANRYVKSKNYEDAIDLLYQGSSILSSKKDYASAGDLISYLVSVYVEAGVKCSNDGNERAYKFKLIELIGLLPDTDPNMADLAKHSLQWSQDLGGSKYGDCDLHHLFGVKFVNSVELGGSSITEEDRQKLYAYGEMHLILGTYESVPPYVGFLYRWLSLADASVEKGLFLSRAVINYAYLKNMNYAQEAVDRFLKQYNETGPEFEVVEEEGVKLYVYLATNARLLNFLQLLIITLTKQESGTKFLKLYNQYKPLLQELKIATNIEYLGRFYFGLKLGNAQGGQNPLASLMGNLFK